jgi:hypothetical protein
MAEQTPQEVRAELLAFARQWRREQRDAKIRAGRAAPRTYREISLWRAGLAEWLPSDDERPEQ